MSVNGTIAALESLLGSDQLHGPGDRELAYDAIQGSMYEEKWRGTRKEHTDQPRLIRRAIERLRALDDFRHLEPLPVGEAPPLGVGWGTYRWKGDGRCLRAALDGGAVLIDTAATYGYGRVEKELGASGIRDRGETWLATKFSRQHARHAPVLASLDRSLTALRVDRVDLLQLHWPVVHVPFEETFGAMKEAQAAGKVRELGVCNLSIDQLDLARRFAPISTVQVRLNANDVSAIGPLAFYCHFNGIRLIAHSPFCQGRKQLPLSWFTERQFIPIPGSNDPKHIKENLNVGS